MKINTPTRARSDVISDKALRLFPDATLCIGGDEVDAYSPLSTLLPRCLRWDDGPDAGLGGPRTPRHGGKDGPS